MRPLGWLEPVWPDYGIKRGLNLPKVGTEKGMCFKAAQNIDKHFVRKFVNKNFQNWPNQVIWSYLVQLSLVQ